MNAIDRLVALLSKLPGIGKKSASRLMYHILDGDPAFAKALAAELAGLHQAIRRCSICGGFTETDPCPVCSDRARDRSVICVVERAQDLRIIEETREFNGLFHVLGGLIAPLEGVSPGDLSIGKLISRLNGTRQSGSESSGTRQGGEESPDTSGAAVKEIILALNPTVEGDTTALYLQKILKDFKTPAGSGVTVTRLASGMPVGGDLEYIDRLTLSRSFRGRVKL